MPVDVSLGETSGRNNDRAERPLSGARLMAIAAVVLAVVIAAGAVLMAASPDLQASSIARFTYVAAVAAGVFAIFRLSRIADSARKGARLSKATDDAVALTDSDGFVLDAGAGDAARGLPVEAAFGVKEGDGAVMRIGRAALADGRASGPVALADGRRGALSAARWSDDALLWTYAPPAPWSLDDALRAELPAAFLAQDGRAVDATEAYLSLPSDDRDLMAEAARSAPADACERRMRFSDGSARVVSLTPIGEEGRAAFASRKSEDEDALGVFEAMPVAVALLDASGRITRLNAASRRLLGDRARVGAALGDIVDGFGRPIATRVREAIAGNASGRSEMARVVREGGGGRGGGETFLQVAMKRVEMIDGFGVAAVVNDATELKVLEQQFVQSQKMQAVGQLAGGVAHDFNNLLTAIIGHCDLMSLRTSETDPAFEDVTQIRQNANRAAALVRQLLAFSRQQKLNPKRCSLPSALSDLSNLLNRLIGERITLEVSTTDDLWDAYLDAQQFEQVILNLVVNARDAMPDGGAIRVVCENAAISEEMRRDRAVVPPGDYIKVDVIDEGVGMNDDVRAQVFEPFFTTKGVGDGTGLGLSTVYGIVKQTGGYIFVDSAPGEGTTFCILLPRPDDEDLAVGSERKVNAPQDLSGAGVILLVEDEAPVRAFARRALSIRGYEVIEAADADEALEALAGAPEVDLIITDVVMPGRDGPTWVREARKARADLPVIFTSGYSDDVFRKGLEDISDSVFLAKPFTFDDLSRIVKEVMKRETA
ncbi:MAG: ATP-binding protein [Pseudomonadota bacterium]